MNSIIKGLIISDFDQTFFNFKEIDNKIIKDIFSQHKLILKFDTFLWKINSLGIIGNTMLGLKFRFLIYSILTIFTGYIKYKFIYYKYRELYKIFATKKYKRKLWILRKIKNKGYTFIILTNNIFASNIGYDNIIYVKSKRLFLKRRKPEYLIGDNFWDDYRNTPKGTKYINVGKGLVSKFKNVSSIKNFYEIFNVINWNFKK